MCKQHVGYFSNIFINLIYLLVKMVCTEAQSEINRVGYILYLSLNMFYLNMHNGVNSITSIIQVALTKKHSIDKCFSFLLIFFFLFFLMARKPQYFSLYVFCSDLKCEIFELFQVPESMHGAIACLIMRPLQMTL